MRMYFYTYMSDVCMWEDFSHVYVCVYVCVCDGSNVHISCDWMFFSICMYVFVFSLSLCMHVCMYVHMYVGM